MGAAGVGAAGVAAVGVAVGVVAEAAAEGVAVGEAGASVSLIRDKSRAQSFLYELS